MFLDHTNLFSVESVCDPRIPGRRVADDIQSINNKDITNILAFGNKAPRYYLNLPHVQAVQPGCTVLTIVRHHAGLAASWNARAKNTEDSTWDNGQRGAFVFIEMLELLDTLLRSQEPENIYLVRYQDMFFGPTAQQQLRDIAARLGVACAPDWVKEFQENYFRPGMEERPHVDIDPVEQPLAELTVIQELETLYDTFPAASFSQISVPARQLVDRALRNEEQIFELFLAAVVSYQSVDVELFFDRWLRYVAHKGVDGVLYRLAKQAGHPLRHYLDSLIAELQGDQDQAVLAAEEAVAADGQHPFFQAQLAKSILDSDPERAKQLMRQAIAIRPEVAQFYFFLSKAYARTDAPQEAFAAAKQAVQLDPNQTHNHQAGMKALAVEQWDQAERYHREAVRLKSLNPHHRMYLGIALRQQGKLAEARKELEHGLELDSTVAGLYHQLCLVLRAEGDRDGAAIAAQRAAALKPDNSGFQAIVNDLTEPSPQQQES